MLWRMPTSVTGVPWLSRAVSLASWVNGHVKDKSVPLGKLSDRAVPQMAGPKTRPAYLTTKRTSLPW